MTPRELYASIVGISETIRELREVPSGVLFNALLTKHPMTTSYDFQRIIETLKRCRLVEEKNHVLRWIGPTLPDTQKT